MGYKPPAPNPWAYIFSEWGKALQNYVLTTYDLEQKKKAQAAAEAGNIDQLIGSTLQDIDKQIESLAKSPDPKHKDLANKLVSAKTGLRQIAAMPLEQKVNAFNQWMHANSAMLEQAQPMAVIAAQPRPDTSRFLQNDLNTLGTMITEGGQAGIDTTKLQEAASELSKLVFVSPEQQEEFYKQWQDKYRPIIFQTAAQIGTVEGNREKDQALRQYGQALLQSGDPNLRDVGLILAGSGLNLTDEQKAKIRTSPAAEIYFLNSQEEAMGYALKYYDPKTGDLTPEGKQIPWLVKYKDRLAVLRDTADRGRSTQLKGALINLLGEAANRGLNLVNDPTVTAGKDSNDPDVVQNAIFYVQGKIAEKAGEAIGLERYASLASTAMQAGVPLKVKDEKTGQLRDVTPEDLKSPEKLTAIYGQLANDAYERVTTTRNEDEAKEFLAQFAEPELRRISPFLTGEAREIFNQYQAETNPIRRVELYGQIMQKGGADARKYLDDAMLKATQYDEEIKKQTVAINELQKENLRLENEIKAATAEDQKENLKAQNQLVKIQLQQARLNLRKSISESNDSSFVDWAIADGIVTPEEGRKLKEQIKAKETLQGLGVGKEILEQATKRVNWITVDTNTGKQRPMTQYERNAFIYGDSKTKQPGAVSRFKRDLKAAGVPDEVIATLAKWYEEHLLGSYQQAVYQYNADQFGRNVQEKQLALAQATFNQRILEDNRNYGLRVAEFQLRKAEIRKAEASADKTLLTSNLSLLQSMLSTAKAERDTQESILDSYRNMYAKAGCATFLPAGNVVDENGNPINCTELSRRIAAQENIVQKNTKFFNEIQTTIQELGKKHGLLVPGGEPKKEPPKQEPPKQAPQSPQQPPQQQKPQPQQPQQQQQPNQKRLSIQQWEKDRPIEADTIRNFVRSYKPGQQIPRNVSAAVQEASAVTGMSLEEVLRHFGWKE